MAAAAMKRFVIRNWRTGARYEVRKASGKVIITPHLALSPDEIDAYPIGMWDLSRMTDGDMEKLKARFTVHRVDGGYHRAIVLEDGNEYFEYEFKPERKREEAVPPYLIWNGARGNGKASRSQEIANRMQQLAGNGNMYLVSKEGTLEEYLAKQPAPPPSKPKLNRRKKKRR